jgi:hypothetical protein
MGAGRCNCMHLADVEARRCRITQLLQLDFGLLSALDLRMGGA